MKKIFELYQKNQMPHFWVIQPNSELSEKQALWQYFKTEFQNFLSSKYKLSYTQLADCADFMILDSDEKTLKVEQMNSIDSFQQNPPLQLQYQFIVITDGQLLQRLHWNKMLKTLEEPHNNTVIFILNPSLQVLMPTISSRAYYYTIEHSFQQEGQDKIYCANLSELNDWSTSQFLEWYGENKAKEKEIIRQLLQQINRQSINFTQHQQLINLLKWSEESIQLNNSFKERALLFKQVIKQLASQSILC